MLCALPLFVSSTQTKLIVRILESSVALTLGPEEGFWFPHDPQYLISLMRF